MVFTWAAQYDEGTLTGRSREKHEQSLSQRTYPVLRIEGNTCTVSSRSAPRSDRGLWLELVARPGPNRALRVSALPS